MEVQEKNVELIQLAIQRLIEEKREERKVSPANSSITHDDEEDHQLLSRLLSQLESLKENPKEINPSLEARELEPLEGEDNDKKGEKDGQEVTEMGTEEIVKELRKVKRQNSVTHWLLSAMIVITALWQFSEVSLLLAVKGKLSDPFKSVGNMISRTLQGGLKESDSLKTSANSKNSQIEPHYVPPLKIPELPLLDLPSLVLNANGE